MLFVAPSRRAWWFPVLVAAALVVAACGGSNGDDSASDGVSIVLIDEILSSEIEITDLTPRSATLQARTGIPVVCSVVYGVDTSYGSQSTDLDMAGQAHSDHHAPLRGLEPDTVYHYRVQGAGSDGTIYVSEDLTFRTPPAGEEDVRGPNLAGADAGARVVAASSTFGDSATWRPENAIDGDPRTEWSSATDGDAAFIEVELATTTEIEAVGLWTRTMGSSAQIIEFRVVLDDGSILGPFRLPNANELYVFDATGVSRTVRFEVVDSSGGNTGAVEVAVFGEQAE